MGRACAFASLVAFVAVGTLASAEACSSDDGALNPVPTNDGAPPVDARAPDARAADACTGDRCAAANDGGPGAPFDEDGGFVGAGCVLDTDCADAGRCGYSTLAGCAATGICVAPMVPVSDGAPLFACGCDGVNVSYVTADTTSAPASSLTPCADAGAPVDAGADAAEAATDASDDATD